MREPIPPGTLDMLVMGALSRSRSELHGFGIAEAIAGSSGEVFTVEEGSLYPALQRMLAQGWIAGTWGHTPDGRRARYYRLTAAGRRQLERAISSYSRTTRAIAAVLDLSLAVE
jgi:PadR family transcriptional regulator PadR